MLDFLSGIPTALQALLATLFTWAVTALGAGVVFLFRKPGKTLLDAMLGFAAGVMVAASFWSLLSPAIETAESLGQTAWLTVLTGFLSGGALLYIGDRLMARLAANNTAVTKRKRSAMLIFSITLHNIPEGMAVGVAFGSAALGLNGATLGAACLLALGIGIQNFPEGAAVSVPLRREGASKARAFAIGQLSGAVEPVAGVIGAIAVTQARFLLPFMLSFAAGAMIYVVVQELIPESQAGDKKELSALFTLIGFSVMMVLDVALS